VVFELSPGQAGWTESVIHSFAFGTNDGRLPEGGLIFDDAGNLYGTTAGGGSGEGGGTVFELSPPGNDWAESILYSFQGRNDGNSPVAGLVFDSAGNLYGTTPNGGTSSLHGTTFELTPNGSGGWSETVLYSFKGGRDGSTPMASLAFDSSGNLYSTTLYGGGRQGCGGLGCGTVFKLTPQNGQWVESLFRFPEDGSRGYLPTSPVTLDSAGNVYGTTTYGGSKSDGVIFKIIP